MDDVDDDDVDDGDIDDGCYLGLSCNCYRFLQIQYTMSP